jgi:hypothetical protein
VDRSEGTVLVGVVSYGRTDCDEAGVFSKLAGPQLAWVGANVATANIGACRINGSIPGRWTATYSKTGSGSPEGPYRFAFACQRIGSTTGGATAAAAV